MDPLFTFPYTSVGEYLHLRGVRMPDLATRHEQYRAITGWARSNGFERVSVWGFRRGDAPRYSSVTRDGYIGIGPGSGSHLSDGFTLDTFDLTEWERSLAEGRSPIALRMPFEGEMGGWWWLYWRFYDTRIPMGAVDAEPGDDAAKARRWLEAVRLAGLATRGSGPVPGLGFVAPGYRLAQRETRETERKEDPAMARFEHDETKSHPLVTEMRAGTYYWCRCGKTRTVPYCDGSHEGSGVTPLAFEIEEPVTAAICSCGLTRNPPYCDGSHTSLD